MVKNKGNEGNQIKDVNVIFQRREETQRNNFKKNSQSTKISKNKKGPNKQITLTCAHK